MHLRPRGPQHPVERFSLRRLRNESHHNYHLNNYINSNLYSPHFLYFLYVERPELYGNGISSSMGAGQYVRDPISLLACFRVLNTCIPTFSLYTSKLEHLI
jgi:hypothetical protein